MASLNVCWPLTCIECEQIVGLAEKNFNWSDRMRLFQSSPGCISFFFFNSLWTLPHASFVKCLSLPIAAVLGGAEGGANSQGKRRQNMAKNNLEKGPTGCAMVQRFRICTCVQQTVTSAALRKARERERKKGQTCPRVKGGDFNVTLPLVEP